MLAKRLRQWLRSQKGLTTVEWIGLAILIIAFIGVLGAAIAKADATSLATKFMNAIGRMFDQIP